MACLPLARYLKGTFLLEVPWRYIAEKVNRRYLGPGVPQRYIREKPPGHLEKNVAPGSKALRTAFPTFSQKPFKRPLVGPCRPLPIDLGIPVYTPWKTHPLFLLRLRQSRGLPPPGPGAGEGGGLGLGWMGGKNLRKQKQSVRFNPRPTRLMPVTLPLLLLLFRLPLLGELVPC